MSKPAIFEYTAPCDFSGRDYENDGQEITVTVRTDGKVLIAVTEEKAVDSYNSTFTCSIVLPPGQAAKLKAILP